MHVGVPQSHVYRGSPFGDAVVFLTSASKFNIEPNGVIFDVSPEHDRESLDVETPFVSSN